MSHLAAVPDRPSRVVLYVRVSAVMGRKGDDFHSPDVQLAAMRRATVGMREVAVVEDLDRSGRTFSREGIDQVRAMADRGEVDALAVYNLSRLGRNTLQSLKFLGELADRGVTILSASEQIDTSTPSGRWMLTTMLGLAEMRSDEIGSEWSNAIRARVRQGKHHGRLPTGYLRHDGRLVPDPLTAAAVRAAFTGYAAGLPVFHLRERLNAVTGGQMAPNTFKQLLANRTYLGLARVRGEEVAGHEPLVDEATFVRVQERIAADRRVPSRVLGARYSVTGLGRCGTCGGNTIVQPRGDGARVICYRKQARIGCTGCGSAPLAGVEETLLRRIVERIGLLRGDVATQAAQAAQQARAGADVNTLRRELDATRRAMSRVTERWGRDQLDDRVYDDTMTTLRATEDRLTAALAGARRTADMPEPGQLVSLAEKLVELWPRMDGGQRNRALRDLVDHFTIRPSAHYRQPVHQRMEIRWRGDS